MTKSEFLYVLENNLKDHLTSSEVAEQMNYYDDYFRNELKKGRTESDILNELGDPVLIAKTIKTVDAVDDELNGQNNTSNQNYNQEKYSNNQQNNNNQTNTKKVYSQSSLGCTLFCIVLFIVLSLGMKFIWSITSILFSNPIVWIALIIMFFFLTGLRKK